MDKVSQRNTQQGGVCGRDTMAGEPRAGAVSLEDHQPRSGTPLVPLGAAHASFPLRVLLSQAGVMSGPMAVLTK